LAKTEGTAPPMQKSTHGFRDQSFTIRARLQFLFY